MKNRRQSYDPNKSYWLNPVIERTEKAALRVQRKLEQLKIRQEIGEIDLRLKALQSMQNAYPRKTDDEVPA